MKTSHNNIFSCKSVAYLRIFRSALFSKFCTNFVFLKWNTLYIFVKFLQFFPKTLMNQNLIFYKVYLPKCLFVLKQAINYFTNPLYYFFSTIFSIFSWGKVILALHKWRNMISTVFSWDTLYMLTMYNVLIFHISFKKNDLNGELGSDNKNQNNSSNCKWNGAFQVFPSCYGRFSYISGFGNPVVVIWQLAAFL